MCRWLAYSGAAVHLDGLIFEPEHSLIDQSLDAYSTTTPTNADGFGLGWYGSREEPGMFKDIRPAWNDRNVRDLAHQIESRLFLAHIRAATGTLSQLLTGSAERDSKPMDPPIRASDGTLSRRPRGGQAPASRRHPRLHPALVVSSQPGYASVATEFARPLPVTSNPRRY